MVRRGITLCIAILAIIALAAVASAANFNVKANYGVRVSEDGLCERVGSVDLTPVDPAVDFWASGTVITVEFLAGAVLCHDVNYDAGSYTIVGNTGDDYLQITVNADYNGTITFGDDNSPVCLNLRGTPYNSVDPNYQLVQISIRDTAQNTYSGDNYVATVKPQEHDITVCSKSQFQEYDEGYYIAPFCSGDCPEELYLGGACLTKEGYPRINIPEYGESQDQTTCGCSTDDYAWFCVDVTDPGNVFTGNYTFSVELKKSHVFIRDIIITDVDLNPISPPSNLVCYNADGEEVDCTSSCEVVKVELQGVHVEQGETYKLWVNLAFDTCYKCDIVGDLKAEVMFWREPCGDSYSEELKVAELCDPACGAVTPTTYSLVMPYAPNFKGAGAWWVGIALTNPNDSDITVTLTFHEADGDTYTAEVTVPAGGLWASLARDISVPEAIGDAQFGDERFWIEAESQDGAFYGFVMFGDNTQAQGYPVMP